MRCSATQPAALAALAAAAIAATHLDSENKQRPLELAKKSALTVAAVLAVPALAAAATLAEGERGDDFSAAREESSPNLPAGADGSRNGS